MTLEDVKNLMLQALDNVELVFNKTLSIIVDNPLLLLLTAISIIFIGFGVFILMFTDTTDD